MLHIYSFQKVYADTSPNQIYSDYYLITYDWITYYLRKLNWYKNQRIFLNAIVSGSFYKANFTFSNVFENSGNYNFTAQTKVILYDDVKIASSNG